MTRMTIAVGLAALAAACSPASRSSGEGAAGAGSPSAVAATDPDALAGADGSACPVIDSRGWRAWINRQPGPDGPRLLIEGEVDLPTPRYAVEITEGPADRMMPPSLRMFLTATPPEDSAPQVVTPTPVRYAGPDRYGSYRVINIICGDTLLVEITDIETVD